MKYTLTVTRTLLYEIEAETEEEAWSRAEDALYDPCSLPLDPEEEVEVTLAPSDPQKRQGHKP